MCNLVFKLFDGRQNVRFRHCYMLHNCKSLFLQKSKLRLFGIMEIHIIRFYQGKGIESDISFGGDLIVELTHGSAAQIPGILILGLCICDLSVDLLEITVSDDRFSS